MALPPEVDGEETERLQDPHRPVISNRALAAMLVGSLGMLIGAGLMAFLGHPAAPPAAPVQGPSVAPDGAAQIPGNKPFRIYCKSGWLERTVDPNGQEHLVCTHAEESDYPGTVAPVTGTSASTSDT